MDESDSNELGEKTREKFAALSDKVSGSSERRDAVSNPDVTWNGSDREDGIVGGEMKEMELLIWVVLVV